MIYFFDNDDLAFQVSRDSRILGKIGLTKKDQYLLHNAWVRLRTRVHRTHSS